MHYYEKMPTLDGNYVCHKRKDIVGNRINGNLEKPEFPRA